MNESRTTCRICHSPEIQPVLSLGTTPLADALRQKEQLLQAESKFPLNVAFCLVGSSLGKDQWLQSLVQILAALAVMNVLVWMVLRVTKKHRGKKPVSSIEN